MITTISDLPAQAALDAPDITALFHKDSVVTFGDIYEQCVRLANRLMDLGIKKGDRVCFYLEKRPEKVIALFAIALTGAVFVPIRRLSSPAQASYILDNCGASILITTLTRFVALQTTPSGLRAVIVLDSKEQTLPPSSNIIHWDELLASGNASASRFPRMIGADPAAIMYTSGSTGRPKGVVLSHGNIVAGARKVSEYLDLTAQDRLLSILTFGFDYGLNQLIMSFMHHAQLVLMDYLFPKDILNAVEHYRITGLAAVATTWIQLLKVPWEQKMRSLRFITNSGGAIPVQGVRELRRRIPSARIYLMYGLTEAFRSTYLEPDMVDSRPDSIGKAVPGEEIMVLDQQDRPVKPGCVGELVHRGELVAMGYWANPDATDRRFRRNPLQPKGIPVDEKVVYSGDYVRVDEEGYLYFIGRRDEMIKCGGNRISPFEVEEILHDSGFVSQVVAMGIPHEIYGQAVCVVLSLHGGDTRTEQDIIVYCRKNMPPYMVPVDVRIWKELPVAATGKLDRAAIKKEILSDTVKFEF